MAFTNLRMYELPISNPPIISKIRQFVNSSSGSARQLNREARPARRVVGQVDAAAMLGDDAAEGGEADAAAASLRGVVRQEHRIPLRFRASAHVVGGDHPAQCAVACALS